MGCTAGNWVYTVIPFVGDGKPQVVIAEFRIVGYIDDISAWLGFIIKFSGDADGFYQDGACAKTTIFRFCINILVVSLARQCKRITSLGVYFSTGGGVVFGYKPVVSIAAGFVLFINSGQHIILSSFKFQLNVTESKFRAFRICPSFIIEFLV